MYLIFQYFFNISARFYTKVCNLYIVKIGLESHQVVQIVLDQTIRFGPGFEAFCGKQTGRRQANAFTGNRFARTTPRSRSDGA